MKSRIPPIIVLLLVLTCCSKRATPADTFAGHGLKIGSVQVTRSTFFEEKEERVEKIDVNAQVKAKLEELLKTRGLYDPASAVTLNLVINDFRLRHGATRFFTGFWSGSDRLGAKLTVADGGRTLLVKDVEVSGGNGNPFAISSGARGTNLCGGLAKVAAVALQREPVFPSPVEWQE